MNVLLMMIPLSILLLLGAAMAFFWAANHDQFDDLESPGILPLLDTDDAAVDAEGTTRDVTRDAF